MKKAISGATLTALALSSLAISAPADARQKRYRATTDYKTQNCLRFNKTTGAATGAVAGGVIGNVVGGGLGTALGAVAGGVAGHELATNKRKNCRRR